MGEKHIFYDYYGNEVQLSFSNAPMIPNAGHVFVICSYQNDWLLTIHPERGYEFPGGKVEVGETPEDAAVREVYEETGGIVSSLTYVGQYKVIQPQRLIVKNIYYAKIASLKKKSSFMETNGPIIIRHLPNDIKNNDMYSYIMKDEVLPKTMAVIQNKDLLKNPSVI